MHSLLFTLTCAASQEQPTCAAPWLYALNAATGSIVWKDEGLSINDVSADGKTVLFQMTSSPWLNFVQGLRS
jgi:outer membrane protein assembly factor BamB